MQGAVKWTSKSGRNNIMGKARIGNIAAPSLWILTGKDISMETLIYLGMNRIEPLITDALMKPDPSDKADEYSSEVLAFGADNIWYSLTATLVHEKDFKHIYADGSKDSSPPDAEGLVTFHVEAKPAQVAN